MANSVVASGARRSSDAGLAKARSRNRLGGQDARAYFDLLEHKDIACHDCPTGIAGTATTHRGATLAVGLMRARCFKQDRYGPLRRLLFLFDCGSALMRTRMRMRRTRRDQHGHAQDGGQDQNRAAVQSHAQVRSPPSHRPAHRPNAGISAIVPRFRRAGICL